MVYVGENSPTDFTITNDVGTPGLSEGDTVTWNPGGGQHPAGQVNSLIFGCNAFTSLVPAIGTVTPGGTVNVEAGTYPVATGAVTVNKTITMRGAQFGVCAGTRTGGEAILENSRRTVPDGERRYY